MRRRDPNVHHYAAAFAIATLLFFGGLWFGSYLSEQKLDVIDELGRNLQLSTLGSELQYQILAEQPCEVINSRVLIDELFSLGSRLDFMESELGASHPTVLELKEYYHLLEIRHWLLMKKVQKECVDNTNLILYFYSNLGDCDRCEEQGTVLTYLHRKYNLLNIYSFDVNIDNPVLNTVKEIYNVTVTPTLVVNGKKFDQFHDGDVLEEAISSEGLQ